MPTALSFDLRSRVLAAIDAGLSCRQAATRFGVSASSAIRWQGNAPGRRGCPAEAAGWRPALASHRGPCRADPRGAGRGARHHPAGVEGALGRESGAGQRERALALLPPAPDRALALLPPAPDRALALLPPAPDHALALLPPAPDHA